MRFLAIPIALILASSACGGHKGGDDPGSFDHLVIEPPSAMLTIALGATATQDYQVFGVTGSDKVDLTGQCELSVNSDFGSFMGGTATLVAHGGKTPVDALCGSVQAASAELTVNMTGTVVDPSAPANAGTIFGGATLSTDPAHTPVVEYPIDQAVSPRNIPAIEVQWKPQGNDLFHIALTSSYGTVDVYTADVKSTLADADWAAVAGTAAGESLKITVEGLVQAAPATKYAAGATSVTMSRDTVDQTAIYYWASSAGNIMNQTFGDSTPPALVKGGCTSCHSVSRQGSRIGYSRCVANDCGQLWAGFLRYNTKTNTWDEQVNADGKTIHGSYTTFAPVGNPFTSDDKAVALVTMNDGSLKLYDPDLGTEVASNIAVSSHDMAGMPTQHALMADWSSDGKTVAFVSTPNGTGGVDLDKGSIMTMSYNFVSQAHMFGEPKLLVPNPITLPNGTYTNFFFPSFSPDGSVVVFDAARAAWRNGSDAAQPGQRLMLSDAQGTWHTDLTALNGGMIDANVTWAHWAPAASTDYYWMVFSSERDYGHEVTKANAPMSCKQNGVKQCKQIWIGAIAKDKLLMNGTVDPSAAPMWLPGQDPKTDNISPYWSVPAGLQ